MVEIVPVPSTQLPSLKCKVCGKDAHGVHFGVTSCRACAAFFRRFVVLDLNYKCLRDKEKCSMKSRRQSCRHCRFQKCKLEGMTSHNVQLNRDIYTSDIRSQRLKSQELKNDENDETVNEPSTSRSLYSVIETQDKLYTKSILAEINYESIEKDMHRMFITDLPSTEQGYFSSLSALDKVVVGLKKIRDPQKTMDIKFHNKLSLETLVPHWRSQAINVATLSMHSMAFRKIPLNEKSRIFKSLWQNIYRFERIQMSTEIFGKSCVTEKKLAISCERAIQLDALFIDIEGVANDKTKVSLHDYKIFAERCVREVARPLSQLNLSIEEVAFLIVNFVVHNEETILGETLTVCDEFRDEIAENLHEYYKKNNIVNYAPRITKMMSTISMMKRIHYDDLGGHFSPNCRMYQK